MAARQTGYTAPVMPVEWMVNPPDLQTIRPCHHCLPRVREWHAIGCAELAFWLDSEGA